MRTAAILCAAAIVAFMSEASCRADPPLVESYLTDGAYVAGEKVLLGHLKQYPKDDQARFGLGALQFLRSIERLGQSLYRYGLRSDRFAALNVPFLRLPVPDNPSPEVCTYPAVRKILEELTADLAKAEATLAEVRDDDVKLPLHLGDIHLDLVGDGKAGQRLSTILKRYFMGGRELPGDGRLLVVFDRGDVAWLRGYCHLLSAMGEVGLAYDGQELFDCAAPFLFAKAKTPHSFLHTYQKIDYAWFSPVGEDIRDVIAVIHLIRMPVKEPERMKTALAHLEKTISLGRESWKHILAETDDDHEWIPNPRQRGAFGNVLRQGQIDSWLAFLDESEALLAGKKLVPFWRGAETRGVNLRRVFTEPRAFDLVLWVQGIAATPYLEDGPMTNADVWRRLQRVFGGELFGFAVWFN
jgi:hypothetical protein